MNRYSVIIKGRVQNVGFRFFTLYTAKNLNLTGWVKNNRDGSVEIEVQGYKDVISNFFHKLKNGNGISKVDSFLACQIQYKEKDKDFVIL